MDVGTIVTSVIAALLSGGGIGGIMAIYYRNRIERQQQSHGLNKDHQEFLNEQNRTMIKVLREEVDSYRVRLARLEKAHDLLRQELAEEYAKDIRLQAEVNRLQQEVARLTTKEVAV